MQVTFSLMCSSLCVTSLNSTTIHNKKSHESSYHMLDPVFSLSTEWAGFCMVIVFTIPRHFVRSHASSRLQADMDQSIKQARNSNSACGLDCIV